MRQSPVPHGVHIVDIVEDLTVDHGYLTSLAERIMAELPCFVRSRPQAATRLRRLLDNYIRYESRVHQPRETCLRDYLIGGVPPAPAVSICQALREALSQPLGWQARLDLRHTLLRLLRESQMQMALEEAGLFAMAQARLSALERHALALRATVYWRAAA